MRFITIAAALAASSTIAVAAHAQVNATYDIPAGSLKAALDLYRKQSGRALVYKPEEVRGATSTGYRGAGTPAQALDAILAGTGFGLRAGDYGSGAIVRLGNGAVAEGGDAGGQDIVVTATRREQTLLAVPVSVLAFSQKALDTQAVRSIDDLARVSPGVSFNTGFSGIKYIAIRGLFSSVGATPTGVYVDETPVQVRSLVQSTNFYPVIFDLERVEVLRGPQGTLFGAGAMGGAIRYILAKPSLTTFSGNARAELAFTDGGAPSYEIGAAVGGPIVRDKIGFRASGYYRRDGGWIDRLPYVAQRGTAQKNSNYRDTYAATAALTFAPTEHLKITPSLFVEQANRNDTDQFWTLKSNPAYPNFTSGEGNRSWGRDNIKLYSLKAEYDLGFASLISNSSILDRHMTTLADMTEAYLEIFGAPFDTALPGAAENTASRQMMQQKSFSQEIRLQSNPGSRLNYVIGLFYQNSRQVALGNELFPQLQAFSTGIFGLDLFGPPLPGGVASISNYTTRDKQFAGFAQVDYDLTDKLKLTAGVRVSKMQFDFYQDASGPLNGAFTSSAGRTKETPVTPKFGVQYTFSRDLMAYATAAKGFRSGGANSPIDPVTCAPDIAQLGKLPNVAYKSDSVWSYELGAKGRIGDKLTFSADIYDVEWKNIQQSRLLTNCFYVFLDNLGSARSRGVDLQLDVSPFRGLWLRSTLTYMDARLTTTTTTPSGLLVSAAGDRIAQARPWGMTIAVDYETRLGARDDMSAYGHIEYDWKSGMHGNPNIYNFNPTYYKIEALHFVTARLGVRKGKADVSLFVTNLTNSQDRFALLQWTSTTDRVLAATYRPRTVGMTAGYRF